MHKISESNIYLAEQHAIITYKCGLRLVALGKSLKQDNNFYVIEYGQFIQQMGLLVQKHAHLSLTYVKQLSTYGFSANESYSKAVEAHSKATRLYSQAITIYTTIVQDKYKAGQMQIQLRDAQNLY